MATHNSLNSLFTGIADAIRSKTGKTGEIVADTFPTEIAGIVTLPDTEQATPSITVSSAGLITASATQTAGYVAAGTKSATKQLTTQAAKTVTPTTSNQTAVASGVYTTGAVTVKGDSNLKAANIASGKSIFGVSGSYTGAPFVLWTNASDPTYMYASSFAKQDITVANQGQQGYLIEYVYSRGGAACEYQFVKVGGSAMLRGQYTRSVSATSTTLTFGDAVNNTTSIPNRILGVKWTP